MKQADVDRYFGILKYHLLYTPLPVEKGNPRKATVDEFMCMHRDHAGCVGFKHRMTRNYVFLVPPEPDQPQGCIHWRLYVPRQDKDFMRGTFDSHLCSA